MKCPACGSNELIKVDGETICARCGYVISDKEIDYNGGGETFLQPFDGGLGSEIGSVDFNGKRSTVQGGWLNGRIKQSRNLVNGLIRIRRYAEKFSLPHPAVEQASYIFRKVSETGLLRGRHEKEMTVAALYCACRSMKLPVTLKEISEASGSSERLVKRYYRMMVEELGVRVQPSDSRAFVGRIASRLGLPEPVARRAVEIIRNSKVSMVGRSPLTVAAAAVYVASTMLGYRREQSDVAMAAGVTEVSIRKVYRTMVELEDADSRP